jgi:hypothetical protein
MAFFAVGLIAARFELDHLALLAALLRGIAGKSDVGSAQQSGASKVAILAHRRIATDDASDIIDGESDLMDAIEIVARMRAGDRSKIKL